VAPVLEAVDLSRAFDGRVALDGLDLEADAGEVVVLLGPNGAGKTTTVRLLNGVLLPDRGRSRVLGLDPTTAGDELRRRTGVLTESAGMDDRLSARQNLAAAAAIRGVRGKEADRRITGSLERFGMGHRADVPLRGASTGERKRVALAGALLHEPEVLFLDEPTSGLDPTATRDVIDLIADLARTQGRTVVLCTHLLPEAGRLASRMAVLDRGRLRASGRPEDLAAALWPGLAVDLDLGGPAPAPVLGVVHGCRGVLGAEATAAGARVRVAARDAVPALVAALVAADVAVYGAAPRPATLEDVYFAVQGESSAASSGRTG
jgi:ABC-2 type transport system ATP-binding protein